jgi:hypothetical protein
MRGPESHNIEQRAPMRLEINIPDELPEAKILGAIRNPSAFVLDLMRQNGNTLKPNPTPDYLAILAQARQSPNCFKTREEVDRYIAELRNEW